MMDSLDVDADSHCCSRKSSFCSRAQAAGGKPGQRQDGDLLSLAAYSARSWIPPCSGRPARTPRHHDVVQPRQYYESAIQMLEATGSECTIGRLVRFWQKPEHVVLAGRKVEIPKRVQGGMSAFAHVGLLVHVRPGPRQKRSRWLQLDWFREGLLCRRTQEEPAIRDELFRGEVELDVPVSLLVAVLREIEHHSYGLLFWNCHHFAEHVWTGLQQPASDGQACQAILMTRPAHYPPTDEQDLL